MKILSKALVLILLICAIQTQAQKFRNAQFTLFSYTYNIDEKITDQFTPVASNITLKADNDRAKINGMIVLSMWNLISKKMQDTFSTYVLPTNSFNDKIKYDVYGLPDISIQKAIKLSDTKYYFKLALTVNREEVDNKGVKIAKDVFVPSVTLKLDIYDKNGYVARVSADGKAVATRPITISKDYINGLSFVNSKIPTQDINDNFYSLLNKAATEVVLQLKYQKKN